MSETTRRGIRLRAAAKINWTLEVLGKRPDGYHEVRSILQTIGLSDSLTLKPGSTVSLSMRTAKSSDHPQDLPGDLAFSVPESNLAYRAAELLRERFAPDRGAAIELEKAIPVAAGLGGGSSDAAAVLQGLRLLWQLDVSDEELTRVAAELGSDVPFFLQAGAAFASGRGEALRPLPSPARRSIVVAEPRPEVAHEKTASMYAAVKPHHYTDGGRTDALAARIEAGNPIRDEDLFNVFEQVLPDVDPESAKLFERAADLGLGQPHLCGSGPAIYFLPKADEELEPGLNALGHLNISGIQVHTLSSDEAVEWEEVR